VGRGAAVTAESGPLVAGDPLRIGSYRVVGRLGEGGQGVVYLGESVTGERVAIKLLTNAPDDEARANFAQEIRLAQRVRAFCTASVLSSGELDGVPYVISEFVDGPSLASVLAERGPLRGAELRRMAIGSLTALAAIHQAGVVHRDFKPGNVLLSRDGPRVIDFGISRTVDAAEPDGDHLTGTPPYMAPEQFGSGAGAPADMFAWAGTVVCAATGRPPFGSGDLPALVNRILYAEPELGDLQGDLREVVSACLAKDPAARPTARAALLRLLGHRAETVGGTADTMEPERLLDEGARRAAPEPQPRRWWRPAWMVAAAVVVAVLAAAGAAVALLRPDEPRQQAAPEPRISSGPMSTGSTTTLRLPGTRIDLHENPADPVWASSYYGGVDEYDYPAYVRDPRSGQFQRFGSFQMPVVSPGGRYVAAFLSTSLTRSDYNVIRLVDRTTREDLELRVAEKPGNALDLRWNRDGRHLLLTLRSGLETTGFVIVAADGRTVLERRTAFGGRVGYVWGPDASTVLTQGSDGVVRLLGLDGTVRRTFARTGTLLVADTAVTDVGMVFATTCRDDEPDVCLWDVTTGEKRAEIPLEDGTTFNGWLDGSHFLATVAGRSTSRLVLAGMEGRIVRVLAEGPADELKATSVWFTPR
jgi:serine/threonine protein kinase